MGNLRRNQRRAAPGKRRWLGMDTATITTVATIAVCGLCILGGCATSGSASAVTSGRSASTPPPLTGTVNPGGPNLPLPTAAPQVAATATAGTARTQAGATDVCAEPVSITAQPPEFLPAYPGAHLHLTETNAGDGFYGYCASDAPDAVAQWYIQQLPGKGWQQITPTTISDVHQVTALQGSTRLVLTVAPDALTAGQTAITAEVLAQ